MAQRVIERPGADEYAPYYGTYVNLVPGGDILALLSEQIEDTLALFGGLSETQSAHR